jgi:hypothetical protein
MSKYSKHMPTMLDNPLLIPFMTLKKLEAEGADSDKVESIKFEFLVDPSNPATRFSQEFFIFKEKMLRTIFKGRALFLFEYHLSKRCGCEDIETIGQELL